MQWLVDNYFVLSLPQKIYIYSHLDICILLIAIRMWIDLQPVWLTHSAMSPPPGLRVHCNSSLQHILHSAQFFHHMAEEVEQITQISASKNINTNLTITLIKKTYTSNCALWLSYRMTSHRHEPEPLGHDLCGLCVYLKEISNLPR